MPATRQITFFWLLALGCMLTLAAFTAETDAKPNDKVQLEAMADALKYLQELDRYYSQVARPSPRSAPAGNTDFSKVEKALKMLQLQELDRFYSARTRPRFGKRTELRPVSEDASPEETSSERLWRRFSKRR